MSNPCNAPLEIERKFLIRRPDESVLAQIPGAVKYEIEQIYLPENAEGERPRIRRRVGPRGVECFYTVKRKITAVTRVEQEHSISPEQYAVLAVLERPMVIRKTRWCLPAGNHTAEVDIYHFWQSTAVVEVELGNEQEEFELPAELSVIREVTGEARFLNRDMAHELLRTGRVKEEI